MKNNFGEFLKKYILAIIFCAFIGGMTLLFFLKPTKEFSNNEKRYFQQMPSFGWSKLADGSFGSDFEKYLSDQFAGRDFFVGLNAYYDMLSGRNGANGIYCGKDGYLINKPTAFDKENIVRNTEKINGFRSATGLPVRMMIVPSTGFIMQNKLPAVHDDYFDADILKLVRETLNDDIKLLDLTEDFQAERDSRQLYYRTDHHWTSAGAYIGYLKYCEAAGLEPTGEREFTKTAYPNFYGTTYSKSALWLKNSDEIELWQSGREQKITVEIQDSENEIKKSDSLFFPSHFDEPDKYLVFLDGNHSLVRVTNKAVEGKKLLLIKDSFAHCMAPFLADQYSEIIMVDLRYYKQPLSSLAKAEGIDEVFVVYGLDTFVTDDNIIWLK